MSSLTDNILTRLSRIRTFLFDVDGVLTDGSLIISPKGDLLRTMNAKDGLAMRTALDKGYEIVIITGGDSEAVKLRLKGLGIKDIYLSQHNKRSKFRQLAEEKGWKKGTVLYMGDDLNDLGIMDEADVATCPEDAVHEIQTISDYISPYKGGRGCVRDVIEKVLRLNDHWLA